MTDPTRIFDVLAKWVAPIGVVALLVLQSQFVTVNDFRSLSGRVDGLELLLVRMESQRETDTLHNKILSDHETRLRSLEQAL